MKVFTLMVKQHVVPIRTLGGYLLHQDGGKPDVGGIVEVADDPALRAEAQEDIAFHLGELRGNRVLARIALGEDALAVLAMDRQLLGYPASPLRGRECEAFNRMALLGMSGLHELTGRPYHFVEATVVAPGKMPDRLGMVTGTIVEIAPESVTTHADARAWARKLLVERCKDGHPPRWEDAA